MANRCTRRTTPRADSRAAHIPASRAGGRVVGLLGLPGDDPVLDIHLPRARPGAVHPVGRPHHLVVPPPLPVELLRAPPALPVHLPEICARRPAGHKELRLAQQLLDGLPGRQQGRELVAGLPVAGLGQALSVMRDVVPCDRLGHLTPSSVSRLGLRRLRLPLSRPPRRHARSRGEPRARRSQAACRERDQHRVRRVVRDLDLAVHGISFRSFRRRCCAATVAGPACSFPATSGPPAQR